MVAVQIDFLTHSAVLCYKFKTTSLIQLKFLNTHSLNTADNAEKIKIKNPEVVQTMWVFAERVTNYIDHTVLELMNLSSLYSTCTYIFNQATCMPKDI